MQTIYIFEMDEKTGEIKRYDISKYNIWGHTKEGYIRYIYNFTENGYETNTPKRFLTSNKFDTLSDWRVASFNDSYENAWSIMKDALRDKVAKAQAELDRYTKAVEIAKAKNEHM